VNNTATEERRSNLGAELLALRSEEEYEQTCRRKRREGSPFMHASLLLGGCLVL